MSELESYKPGVDKDTQSEKNTDNIFSPEKEIKNIIEQTKYLSRNTRQERIDEFKEKLNNQLDDIARLSLFLEDRIRKNPDITENELNIILDKNDNKLSENQINIFKEKISNYIKVHNSIKNTLSNYHERYSEDDVQWKNELFKDMFGEYPQSEVNLVIKPTMLYWETSNINDYKSARINGYEKQRKAKLSDIEKNKIDNSLNIGAFVISDNLLTDLNAPVGVISSRAKKIEKIFSPFRDIVETVNTHEERHSIDFAIKPNEESKKIENMTNKFNPNTSESLIVEKIPRLIELSNISMLNDARSEILSFYEPADMFFGKSKLSNLTDLILRHFILKKMPFDLAEKNSEKFKKQFPAQIFHYVQSSFENYNYMQKTYNSINEIIVQKTKRDFSYLVKKEVNRQAPLFKKELLQALVSAEILGKYSKLKPKELMWLLQNEDIKNWHKLVKRADEQVKNDFQKTYQQRLEFYNKEK